jgi:hypothetical protein
MTDQNQILFYEAPDGETKIEVLYEGETVWLNQSDMADLFQSTKQNISVHINNIYDEGEVPREGTVKKYLTVQKEGSRKVKRQIDYYNLDVIISVGYRVNSRRGTQFRIWATQKLKEYIIKGFVMDDERLQNGGSNYFEELHERVRRIRTSEVNFYKKVRFVFATSIDYDTHAEEAGLFYATVQNKFHYAIHGHTAAELILKRINKSKYNLGLTSWSGKVVTLKDAVIAKNYLEEIELKRLQLLVDQFLSFAELQILEKKPMFMRDWIRKLDEFIRLNEKEVLTNAGTVSSRDMQKKVRKELEAYRERVIAEEALQEDEFNRRLAQAEQEMLPPPEDEVGESGSISREHYDYLLKQATHTMHEDEDLE